MEGETYHLIDREVLLHRVKQLEFNSPERMFLLDLMDNTVRIHKPQQNYHIDILIRSCEEGKSGEWDCSTDEGKEGFNDMIYMLEHLKI